MNKKISWKKQYGKCAVCGESNYSILDVHRIIPGEKNGQYVKSNIIILCANDHRRTHSGDLKIVKKTKSTKGEVLIYEENNQEKIVLL